jgi:hypothetical protein
LLRATIATVVAMVGTATVLGLLDRLYWPFELADVFRLQYLAVLVACALGALALRRRRLGALAAILAAVNLAVLGVSLIPTATAAPGPAMGSLRVMVACGHWFGHRCAPFSCSAIHESDSCRPETHLPSLARFRRAGAGVRGFPA